MKLNFLKKGIILSLFLCVIPFTKTVAISSPKQAKSHTCPTQITVFAKGIDVPLKSGDSLKEIAKPYLGVYECKWLYFGGEDKKKEFEYLRVELKTKGELLVTYKLKKGEKGKVPLSFEYDYEEKQIRVFGQWMLLKIDRKFPLEKGELNVVTNLFGKLVNVKFLRK
ncbi:MAG: hypothetical protein IKA72_01625 [Clostridia bacterium]|nr:hypothetical protein [Clostridia bacterium]